MAKKTGSTAVAANDLADLQAKLSKWVDELPEAQRAIGQVIVEHAHGLTPERIALAGIARDMRESARRIIDVLNRIRDEPVAWVQIGPIWQRRNDIDRREEVELVQRLFLNTAR
jgi:hypothetical protein